MNASTLRRLRADRKDLYARGLPPNYLFPPDGSAGSTSDELTQLAILITGPHGTPYSHGLWKLRLLIPDDYPKTPPRASFRTRIWHPNVDESSGDVCVNTLKRDWDQSLTLREVLLTISCLLIHPNPDSALNSTAGHLLQEDFEAFARQAKLMTSVHARIPPELEASAHAARMRGEDVDAKGIDARTIQPPMDMRFESSSIVVMKPKTQNMVLPEEQLPTVANAAVLDCDTPIEMCAYQQATGSKENHWTLLSSCEGPPTQGHTSRLKRPFPRTALAQEAKVEPNQPTDTLSKEEYKVPWLLHSPMTNRDNKVDLSEHPAKRRCSSTDIDPEVMRTSSAKYTCDQSWLPECNLTGRKPAAKKLRTGLRRL
ncbi:MAG: hypothetical protein Q9186_003556 [Xanthomendoza sp. 1 TL-2023]